MSFKKNKIDCLSAVLLASFVGAAALTAPTLGPDKPASLPHPDQTIEAILGKIVGVMPISGNYAGEPQSYYKDSFADVMARNAASMQDPICKQAVNNWFAQFDYLRDKPLGDKIIAVDTAVDKMITYCPDEIMYPGYYTLGLDKDHHLIKVYDHWATPLETISNKKGDCEDYAILKYYTLRYLGVPADRLYLTIVDRGACATDHAVLLVDMQQTPPATPCPEKMVLLNLVDIHHMFVGRSHREVDYVPNIALVPNSGCRPYDLMNEKNFFFYKDGQWTEYVTANSNDDVPRLQTDAYKGFKLVLPPP